MCYFLAGERATCGSVWRQHHTKSDVAKDQLANQGESVVIALQDGTDMSRLSRVTVGLPQLHSI